MFLGVEAAFRRVPGVFATAVGYLGGVIDNPTYEDVCSGTTQHAEVVKVVYDPRRVSYEQLLEVFFENHDPTTLNRQGPDVGTQYRSGIFYHDENQAAIAREVLKKFDASGRFRRPIVTEISPAPSGWPRITISNIWKSAASPPATFNRRTRPVMNAREYPDRPWVGVGVVVWSGDQVLLVRRARIRRARGAGVFREACSEVGETAQQAGIREVFQKPGSRSALMGLLM